jgi:uncharacterized protein (DUF1499 family)
MFIKIVISIIALIIIYFFTLSFLTRHHSLKQESERQLEACPQSPNCVLSTSTVAEKSIKPFSLLNGHSQYSWQALINTIKNEDGIILINDGTYLHAVFTSSIFRFKDDLEAQLTEDHIDVRSASRAGKSDLGQNRKRIEHIRSIYQKTN